MILEIDGVEYAVVVYASDCFVCPLCQEPVCPLCKDHYAECECPGPDSEELSEYENTIDYYDAVVLGYIADCREPQQVIH